MATTGPTLAPETREGGNGGSPCQTDKIRARRGGSHLLSAPTCPALPWGVVLSPDLLGMDGRMDRWTDGPRRGLGSRAPFLLNHLRRLGCGRATSQSSLLSAHCQPGGTSPLGAGGTMTSVSQSFPASPGLFCMPRAPHCILVHPRAPQCLPVLPSVSQYIPALPSVTWVPHAPPNVLWCTPGLSLTPNPEVLGAPPTEVLGTPKPNGAAL